MYCTLSIDGRIVYLQEGSNTILEERASVFIEGSKFYLQLEFGGALINGRFYCVLGAAALARFHLRDNDCFVVEGLNCVFRIHNAEKAFSY